MSFALSIKKEVLSQEFAIVQAKSLISGIISSSLVRIGSKFIIKINNVDISNIIRDMMDQLGVIHYASKENKNWIVINEYLNTNEIKQPSHFFAGVFVGGGSISDIDSNSYHLEIQLYSHAEAKKIQNYLNKYNFNFNLIQRRKMYVLYLKKSEQISDFLKAIQAFNSLMQFEDTRISRDIYNQFNRYSNLDVYNQKKLAKSTDDFKFIYKSVKENGFLDKFREPEIDFYELKIQNPYMSMVELKDLYFKKFKIQKTKSGLNHWMIKLRKIYNLLD